MKKIGHRIITALLFSMATIGSSASFANEDAIEYRQDVFASSEHHIKAAFAIFLGKVPYSEHLVSHANALNDFGQMIPVLFPSNSAGGDALPSVWAEPDLFGTKAAEFQKAALAFKAAATKNDPAAIQKSLPALGQACKSCHDKFRKE